MTHPVRATARRLAWLASVWVSRWRHRVKYVLAAPIVYRNWWALPAPKFGLGFVLELRNGLRYHIRPRTTDLGVINEAFILDPYLSCGRVSIHKDDTVVDIGANIGDFTLQAARLCPSGHVFAIEPVSEHVEMIKANVRLNGFRNVTCLQEAVGAVECDIEIHVRGTRSNTSHGNGRKEIVRQRTLQQLIGTCGIDRIDLLKLDCEGAEWDILPHAQDVFPWIRQICMEFHCERGWTPERLAGVLRQCGYQVWYTPAPWNGLLWAVRMDAEHR